MFSTNLCWMSHHEWMDGYPVWFNKFMCPVRSRTVLTVERGYIRRATEDAARAHVESPSWREKEPPDDAKQISHLVGPMAAPQTLYFGYSKQILLPQMLIALVSTKLGGFNSFMLIRCDGQVRDNCFCSLFDSYMFQRNYSLERPFQEVFFCWWVRSGSAGFGGFWNILDLGLCYNL